MITDTKDVEQGVIVVDAESDEEEIHPLMWCRCFASAGVCAYVIISVLVTWINS